MSNQPPKRTYRVHAAREDSGRSVVLNIDAHSPHEAEQTALAEGWLVSMVTDAKGNQLGTSERTGGVAAPAPGGSEPGQSAQILAEIRDQLADLNSTVHHKVALAVFKAQLALAGLAVVVLVLAFIVVSLRGGR